MRKILLVEVQRMINVNKCEC